MKHDHEKTDFQIDSSIIKFSFGQSIYLANVYICLLFVGQVEIDTTIHTVTYSIEKKKKKKKKLDGESERKAEKL